MATILVVEDEVVNRELFVRYFTILGYQVIVAVNGVEAVATAEAVRPALILMDMELPQMDGWQATRIIKANPTTRAIPVIALTAYAMIDERERCFAAGCDEYEAKPVDFSRLLIKMRTLLDSTGVS